MKNIAFLILLFAIACKDSATSIKKETGECTPSWLEGVKTSIIQSGNKGRITKFTYQKQSVFLIEGCLATCADFMDIVKDCSGNTICEFGGITGKNTCPDFDKSVKVGILWEN